MIKQRELDRIDKAAHLFIQPFLNSGIYEYLCEHWPFICEMIYRRPLTPQKVLQAFSSECFTEESLAHRHVQLMMEYIEECNEESLVKLVKCMTGWKSLDCLIFPGFEDNRKLKIEWLTDRASHPEVQTCCTTLYWHIFDETYEEMKAGMDRFVDQNQDAMADHLLGRAF